MRAVPRLLLITLALTVSCAPGDDASDSAPAAGIAELQVWAHAGQEAERQTLQAQVETFNARNARQSGVRVTLTLLPEGSYNAQVQAAALAGELPDLLEFDGPFVYNYVWQGHLQPLDELLTLATTNGLIPSIVDQGTFRGHLYAVGTFDSGLG